MKSVPAFVPLLLALAVGTGIDQWSKSWASRSLATEEHPIPLRVAHDGQTAGELVETHFPGASAALRRLEGDRHRAVMRMDAALKLAPETPVFSNTDTGAIGRTLSMWVFEGESLESPPRRLPAIGQLERDLDEFTGRPLHEYLRARFPADSDERVARLARDWTFAVDYTEVGLDAPLSHGDLVLMLERAVPVIDGLAQLRYAENPGAGWGILGETSAGFRRTFFQIFTVLALTLLLYIYWRGSWLGAIGGVDDTPERLVRLRWAVALLLAGAVGNFIDRFRFNHVIDFVDIYTGGLHWPTFNVADVLISIGSLLLIWLSFVRGKARRLGPGPDGGDESAPER